MRRQNDNMTGHKYPKTKNYLQKVFFRKVFGKKLYKYFKVIKIVLFYKFGKSFEISEFLKQIIKDDFVIFDVGANLGQYAIRFSSFLKNKGKVISIEPVYEDFLLLCRIKKKFRLDNLLCSNYAVSDVEKTGDLFIPVIDHDIELDTRATVNLDNYYFEYDNYKTQPVKITTLQSVFNDYELERLDIVKSDTEGNDNKVILGSLDLIKKYMPLILVEDSHEEKWLNEIYAIGYSPFYVIKNRFLIDAFMAENHKSDVKYDLLVLVPETKLNDFTDYFMLPES